MNIIIKNENKKPIAKEYKDVSRVNFQSDGTARIIFIGGKALEVLVSEIVTITQ